MCGIIGIVGKQPAAPHLLTGLQHLEYRGYDSAGIAIVSDHGIERRRAEGKLCNLKALIDAESIDGKTGIGHTRWATHGRPNQTNAHPHATDTVALVHNGIIENYRELRQELEDQEYVFESETDSEVIAQLISHYLSQSQDPEKATTQCLERLEGAFALAAIFANQHDLIIAARRGAPLAVGHGDGEMYLASDSAALAPITENITYLEEDDRAFLTANSLTIRTASGENIQRPITHITHVGGSDKGNFPHYMLKEIHEQPTAISDTLTSFIDPQTRIVTLPDMGLDWQTIPKINLVACGSSHYATLTARYWFEEIANIPTQCDLASEFRYRDPVLPENGVAIFVSQSGETADSLAALRHARKAGQYSIAIVNVPESTMAREADFVLATHGGPEISVASTKALTTQLTVLAVSAIAIGRARHQIDPEREATLSQALIETPTWIAETLRLNDQLRQLGHYLADARNVLYLGRGTHYPIALEGALKLKEISYIHAEGYAAGEMKHGPIALVTHNLPVIFTIPNNQLFAKTLSNMEEVAARGGHVIALSDAQGLEKIGTAATQTVLLPEAVPFVTPMIHAVAVQLLAYYTATAKGTDVDQPRNLAKSVTVE